MGTTRTGGHRTGGHDTRRRLVRGLACAGLAAVLATVGACSPDADQSGVESGQSSQSLSVDTADTVLLTATDSTGAPMTGEQIRASLLGGEEAAAAADALRERSQSGAQSGDAQSGTSQSGTSQSGGVPTELPRGLAVVDPTTWEVEEDEDPVVGVEEDGIRVELPPGGAAIAFVWPLSEKYGYSQVVIGDDGSPIRPGGTLDLTLRALEELTSELTSSVSDALDDTSGKSPVPSFDVSTGLAKARQAVEAATPSTSPSTGTSSTTSGGSDSAQSGGSDPTPSSSASRTPVADSLAALDATWRTWLGELGRSAAGTASQTGDTTESDDSTDTGLATSPSTTPSDSTQSTTDDDPLADIWRAVTLDDATSPDVTAALDDAKRAAGDGQGWVRIVADPDKSPSDYDLAVTAAHERGLKVMLTPTDSSAAVACTPGDAPTQCTTDDYLARLTTYLDHFTGSGVPDVDAWEVGDEANDARIDTEDGTYEAGSGDMAVKVTTATTLVRSRTSAPVVLTLDWDLATSVHADSSTFTWAHSQASTSGAESPDVVLLATWVDTSPLGIGILPALEHLASTFPGAKVGIGELGVHTGSDAGSYDEFGVATATGTRREESFAQMAGWYTQAMTCVPSSIGGGFWWTFQEDATSSGGTTLVDALEAAASGS